MARVMWGRVTARTGIAKARVGEALDCVASQFGPDRSDFSEDCGGYMDQDADFRIAMAVDSLKIVT